MTCCFSFLICKMGIPICYREQWECITSLTQKWAMEPWSLLTLQVTVPTESLYFHHPGTWVTPRRQEPTSCIVSWCHVNTNASDINQASHIPSPLLSTVHSKKLGSRKCFQQDCATGCQVKNDLSCYKQTKQSSFQDVGLLFVWTGTWANTGMFQFEIASGVIVGSVFPNYIMSVFFGSDLSIVLICKSWCEKHQLWAATSLA